MRTLNTTTAFTQFQSQSQSYNGSNPLVLNVPNSTVIIPKSLSYSFRVAEFVDDAGNIVKVGLQGKIFEHDAYGAPNMIQDWSDIPRVQIDLATGTVL